MWSATKSKPRLYRLDKEIEHNIYYENGELFKCFLHSNWYDTATPYQYCVKELKEIRDSIAGGQKLKFESYGKTHFISTQDEFKNWIENVFYGGYEKFVFET